jgi:hypothetical protein
MLPVHQSLWLKVEKEALTIRDIDKRKMARLLWMNGADWPADIAHYHVSFFRR